MRFRSVLILVALLCSPAIARAMMFNVTLTSGDGQFPGKQAAPFGNTVGPVDIDLTPDTPGLLQIAQFSGFQPGQVFPYEPGASTTITQTLTVNGVSTTVNRTLTLLQPGACDLVQALSPVTVTVDLGVDGKVTLTLATPATLAFPCSAGQPSPNTIIIVPGTTTPINAAVLDNFVFYKVKGSKGAPKLLPFGPVELDNLFDFAAVDVTKITALGLPAGRNGAGVFDDDTHLLSYAIKRRKSSGKFFKLADTVIPNECGRLYVTLVKLESLLVPVNSGASPSVPDTGTSEVDHFVCYKAKMQKKRLFNGAKVDVLPKGFQLSAADHFQTRRYDVKKVTRVCLPVDKSGTPIVLKTGNPKPITPSSIRHFDSNLVCYQVKPAKSLIAQNACGPLVPKDKGTKIVPAPAKQEKQLGVQTNGQLGAATLDTASELEICVPVAVELPLA
ncbi:MAG: hypothetical protein ABIR79_19940 [Candidatus Binatia bacterium]